MTNTGNVSVQGDIHSRDIVTGLKIDSLTVVMTGLDDLSQVVSQGKSRFRLTDTGSLEAIAGEQPPLSLPPNVLEAFKQLPRAIDLSPAERHRAYAAWLVTRRPQRPAQRVAAREHYIDLSGHFSWDWEDDPLQPHFSWLRTVGEGPERRIERERLEDVTQAVQRFSAFVLLGPPGSGKSTVLERLLYTAASDYLAGRSQRLPLLVTLASFRWERHQPLEFIRDNWAALVAGDFVELVRAGQVLLLVDGLNEMARLEHADDRSHRAATWRRFFDDHFAEESPYSSRVVIASRDADDYEQRLGLARVEIDPLTPAQVECFARAYLPDQTEPFLAALARLELEQQAANPFSLYILTQLYDPASGDLPRNRGRLFAGYAARLLSVMYKLADKELQIALLALAHLGYQMQLQSESTVLPAEQLQALLPATVRLGRRTSTVDVADLFDRACRAGLLLPDPSATTTEAYKFGHQLLQEQFAAQHLLVCWQNGEDVAGLWRTPRTPVDMPAPEVGEWDPLPPPPPTGWEQTTILAAGMLEPADAFVRAVLAANPTLAGRCLAEGSAPVAAETRAAVQQGLLSDLSNPILHLRARIQAGRVLGDVGDPRFEPATVNGANVILPDFIEIPGGTATLGSDDDEAYGDEQPLHQVEIAPFYLARHPVTNAEYGCFIEAGGYDTERYWTPTGWQWRQGKLEESGPVEDILDWYRYYHNNPREIDKRLKAGRMMPDTADTLRALIKMPEEEVRQLALKTYAPQPHEQPYYWDDPAYNASNQPVVGVTWYEAMAYCAWLTDLLRVSGFEFQVWRKDQPETQNLKPEIEVRLPTEAEWEWVVGGPGHTRYAWGKKFDEDKANTLEGRALGTTPVGAYPAGAAAGGALDMTGNVWEWTHSLYRDYPYRQDDGREDPLTGGRRVLRGGSWYNDQRNARASSRNLDPPDSLLQRRLRFSCCCRPCLLTFWLLAAGCWFLRAASWLRLRAEHRGNQRLRPDAPSEMPRKRPDLKFGSGRAKSEERRSRGARSEGRRSRGAKSEE